MLPHRFGLSFSLAAFIFASLMALPALGDSRPILAPLRAHPDNPNYFADGAGRAVYLTGSHTWNNFQDWGTEDAPQHFDFEAYAKFLRAHGHNFTLIWQTELPTFRGLPTQASGSPDFFVTPMAWERTGPGNATDGKPKFDLTKFNQAYFDRMRARVKALQDAGIYAGVYLFSGEWILRFRFAGDGYPLTGANNINGIDDGGALASTTMTATNAITEAQDAFVRKLVDALNDLPNVLWIVSQEAAPGSEWWNNHLISVTRAHEATKRFQHPIGFGVMADNKDATILNSDADWIAPAVKISPTTSCGSGHPACKVNVNDSDHSYFGMWNDSAQANRNFFWINFTQGNQSLFMDPYVVFYPREGRNLPMNPVHGISAAPDPRWDNVRDTMGFTRAYAERMDLAAMSPRGEIASTGHALMSKNLGHPEILVYAPFGGSFTVNLTNVQGTLAAEWMNPTTGAKSLSGDVSGGGTRIFTPPFRGDAVLYLSASVPSEGRVKFSQSADSVEAYDFVEIVARVEKAQAQNPFLDISVTGEFSKEDGSDLRKVDGFCDSADGSVSRIRFMPSNEGAYKYSVEVAGEKRSGSFKATAGRRKGPVRVDRKYPWHFVWEGSGEHYFFNGTTAFWLMGWRDEGTIQQTIDRLEALKINRLRVLIAGAANILWGEPVMTGDNFTLFLRPWVAEAPKNFDQPKNDYTRFNVAYWQKWERMLRYARDHDMIISAILDISTHNAQPAAGSDDERRYIRYAVARLGAFSNITWDLGDDLDSYRDEKWAHETGTLLESWDPYKHLATSHPVKREHQDRASDWFGFTSIQDWSRAQHALMLEERQIQIKTGRIIPQTNEEYGYEDHYPHWAPKPDGDSAETLRRCAWDIAMAGAYGTAGESARRGVNIWPDMGGGWINGRGDDTMVMLKGYEHMVDFFMSFEWWKTEPHDELVNNGAYCLAKPGEIYAVYLPNEGSVTVKLQPGRYQATWFGAFTGQRIPIGSIQGPAWTSPKTPGWSDWALLITKSAE